MFLGWKFYESLVVRFGFGWFYNGFNVLFIHVEVFKGMSHQGYKNNGVLVLVSTGDRRVEVEIGQGLNHVFNREEWLQHMIHSRMTLGQANTFGEDVSLGC